MGSTTQTRRGFLKSAGLAAGAMLTARGCGRSGASGAYVMDKPTIDIHVHTAASDLPGCKISNAMRRKFTMLAMLGVYDMTREELRTDGNAALRRHLVGVIDEADTVDAAVFLALDGIYRRGVLDEDRTRYMVSNRYVQQIAREHHLSGVLFGASVNPDRGAEGALRELKRCTGELPWPGEADSPGPPPALIKWLPNAQEFDPSAGHDAFFEALVERDLPLLSHAGKEHAVPTRRQYQKMGNPVLLRRALEIGVTVIVAHCGAMFNLLDWRHHHVRVLADMLAEAKDRGWALYADVSALSMSFRSSLSVRDVIRHIAEPHGDRLVLGSDYPLPPGRCRNIANPLDRNYHWLIDRGFPPSIGSLAAKLLNPKALAWTPKA